MDYETVKIKKVEGSCPACEEYAEKHSTDPKIAIMSCEAHALKAKLQGLQRIL